MDEDKDEDTNDDDDDCRHHNCNKYVIHHYYFYALLFVSKGILLGVRTLLWLKVCGQFPKKGPNVDLIFASLATSTTCCCRTEVTEILIFLAEDMTSSQVPDRVNSL